MSDTPRLIEHAFPLKQASLDSVHEKNVRHGHISTLHIWPARRPLAACRAALIATLLPDPSAAPKPAGMSDAQWEEEIKRRRKELCEKIGGRVVRRVEKKKMPNGQIVERIKEETEGGILHWGRETENAADLEWFRQEIRKAYGGRAPKVLDPFAGGGAIPLEAMRLGCEATAIDINPVAWFILKCTLEYPQKLAGQTRPLPEFVLHDDDFMREFFAKANGYGKAEVDAAIKRLHDRLKKKAKAQPNGVQTGLPFAPAEGSEDAELQADLAWHVRAWGRWVLARARRELAPFYPTYADFEPLKPGLKSYERQPMQLVPLRDDGTPDIEALNADFTEEYLADGRNPRWVAKPTVGYLWARTVKCKNCRATVPLLKTRWLCKKANKRTMLSMDPNGDRTCVVFDVETNVPARGANNAAKREHDKRIAAGTMTRSGVTCPCCGLPSMTMDDIRLEGRAGRLGTQMTAVMIEGPESREYRCPTPDERNVVADLSATLNRIYHDIPNGQVSEPLKPESTRSISCDLYGIDSFGKVFTPRQQAALGQLVRITRDLRHIGHSELHEWIDEVYRLLALNIDRVADRSSTFCRPDPTPTQSGVINTFSRFSLPITWDFIEGVPIAQSSGGYLHSLEWIAKVVEHLSTTIPVTSHGTTLRASATEPITQEGYDVILTDPPYYEAISYADLSDFFYIWQRRLNDDMPEFSGHLADKSMEIVQHVRGDKSRIAEKQKYEDRMSASFVAAHRALKSNGRFGIVFAHKQPDAWETLVTAMIKAGFVVTASWPIQTEMGNRGRAISSAALASSVWLVCKKRPLTAAAGWDSSVVAEMRKNITKQLREFWDAGIRGPDFVWAATGPALEAYSSHPVVKKADSPGAILSVSEFLTRVRRMVVDFVVGRVLSGDGDAADQAAADKLDEPTAYYLLHRHDFGMDEAPAGACILYATACGLTDGELADTWDILVRTGGTDSVASGDEDDGDEADADSATEEDEGSGSKLRLKTWAQRTAKSMGHEAPGGRPVPLIDRVHRLMHVWKAGDVHKVDEYLDDNALRRNELFKRLLQSLIELSPHGSDERSLLESLSNHVGAKGAKAGPEQSMLQDETGAWTAEPSSREE